MTRPIRTPAEERRLESAWLDPEVTISGLMLRFGLNKHDVDELKAQYGPKVKGAALSMWRNPNRTRRTRRGWA